MRRLISAIWIILSLMCLLVPASAHPGRTDGSGGHTDRSTGEYHYHHGYPAHDHYDMDGDGKDDCPYNFVDKTDTSNRGSYSSEDTDSFTYYSRPSIQSTETNRPEEIDSKKVIDTKEQKKMPPWGYWVIGILGCFAAVQFLIIRSLSKDIDLRDETIRENKKKNESLKSKIDTLIDENLRIAISEGDWEQKAAQIKKNSDAVIKLKDRRIATLTRKIEILQSEKDELYQKYPFAKTEPNQPYLCKNIILPDDVYFTNGTIPVKGYVTDDRPFGEFTVFVTIHGKKYHKDKYCGSIAYSRPAHIYEILEDHTPCTRCALTLPFQPGQIPEWYIDIKELAETL